MQIGRSHGDPSWLYDMRADMTADDEHVAPSYLPALSGRGEVSAPAVIYRWRHVLCLASA